MVKDILSQEDTNICNQHDSSISKFYPDFKFYSPSYINVNSPLKDSSKNLKVYHQNIRGLKGKICQLSNILYSELPYLLYITEHHLIDLEIDMKSIRYFKNWCQNGGVCIFVHESIDFNTTSTYLAVSRLAINLIEF